MFVLEFPKAFFPFMRDRHIKTTVYGLLCYIIFATTIDQNQLPLLAQEFALSLCQERRETNCNFISHAFLVKPLGYIHVKSLDKHVLTLGLETHK